MGVGSWLALQSFGLVSAGKRNLAHGLNGKKINKSKIIKGCKETRWFSSHHGSNWLSVVQSTWREREFIFPEREVQEDGAFKSARRS